jgi:carboxylesterase
MSETPNTEPFFFPAGRGDAAALLVHGFTGTPYEMRGLGLALQAAGISARGIRLPGHESAERMITATRADWRRAVRDAYFELKAAYGRVALVGLSTGALLSLDLAAEPGAGVAAVASLAAPMFLYGFQARYVLPVLARTPLRTRMKWVKESPGNIKDAAAQARHPSIRWCHIGALEELRALIPEVRAQLPMLRAPLLVVHAKADTTALVKSARIVFAEAGSAEKERVILPQSYHVITVDLERDLVERDVVGFLRSKLDVQRVTAVER